MTSPVRQIFPPLTPAFIGVGFVVAMRAKIASGDGAVSREWIVVSRWGEGLEYLSIARTFAPVGHGQGPPLRVAPRWTLLARLLRLPGAMVRPTFLFAAGLPVDMSLAGMFTPAEGHVRLSGPQDAPGLRAEGRYLEQPGQPAWRMEGRRAPWFGEFIERAPAEASPKNQV